MVYPSWSPGEEKDYKNMTGDRIGSNGDAGEINTQLGRSQFHLESQDRFSMSRDGIYRAGSRHFKGMLLPSVVVNRDCRGLACKYDFFKEKEAYTDTPHLHCVFQVSMTTN